MGYGEDMTEHKGDFAELTDEQREALAEMFRKRRKHLEELGIACSTPDCLGDGRYVPPGRSHRIGCTHLAHLSHLPSRREPLMGEKAGCLHNWEYGDGLRECHGCGTVERSGEKTCPHRGDSHGPKVCAVHVALAESAGIYDLTDDEAAEFVSVYESRLSTVTTDD